VTAKSPTFVGSQPAIWNSPRRLLSLTPAFRPVQIKDDRAESRFNGFFHSAVRDKPMKRLIFIASGQAPA
jgi:hypothetical protein